ncbi:MAG: CDGSH iron-sulfur domain-containing protein [Thermoproteota archaeon]|nr:CDGSH iron-sulfur domain-containing protein [Thermoproteota archaeon]
MTSSGQEASREHYTLCHCGASRNKPFCDGSHNEINIKNGKTECGFT